MKHKLLLLCGVWSVFLLCASDRLAAEAPAFTLDVEAQGKKIPLTVPPSRQVEFSLVQSKAPTPPAAIDFHLSPFIGEEGNTVAVQLVIPGLSENPQTEHAGIKFDKSVLRLRLVEVNLPTAGKYTGSLIVTPTGADSKSWQIELSRAANYQPGVLVLDQQTITADITRPFLDWCLWRGITGVFFGWDVGSNPEFTVRIRDKTGQWDLNDVTARLEQASKTPGGGFDLARNLAFKFDGKEQDLTAAPAKPTGRTVIAGHQAIISVIFKNLEAGEYNGTLRFTAVNSSADDAQKLAFVLRVRHSIGWAICVLGLALIISFVTTKVITILRNRYALLKKISDVDYDWLDAEPPVLTVVWVRSILLQSKERAGRFWLSGLDVIEERVNRAAAVIELLDGVRQLRDAVEMLPGLVAVRARAALQATICDLDPRALDDQKATVLNGKLAELRGWLDEEKLDGLYWSCLSVAIKRLLEDVRIADIKEEEHQRVLEKLVASLQSALKEVPVELSGKIEAERTYARLKILWHRRGAPEDFKKLVELQQKDPPLEDLFHKADDLAWIRLKKAVDADGARIVGPVSHGAEPLQAFRPLIFEFKADDPDLNRTYLVMRGLTYTWNFERREATSAAKSNEPQVHVKSSAESNEPKVLVTFDTSSEGPNVVEYAEGKGTFGVTLQISRKGDKTEKMHLNPTLPIEESKDFAWKEGLESVEIFSFFVAGIFALITGLSTLYFKNPSFGSVQDYISLFLWGAAVDQSKNALQLLQSYSATPGK